MKAKLLFLILVSLLIAVKAQQNSDIAQPSPYELKPLSQEEIKALKDLPVLTMPEGYRTRSLPAVVDNSSQPYMREVFQQTGLCCGQAAGIAYNYTYEIDRERNLPANNNDNLYPTHFTWNWMHGGSGWYGVSYLHSFQVLRHCGEVNVTDYGGALAYGGYERWMSGYDSYLNGMGNRINSIYQINVGTPEGLEVFKHWINDHLESSSVGGVGSFYSQYMSASNTLPPGTPEEGKYVLTSFGGSANHAQTIIGYNDSIRWDYNGDGQYTNHIDINNDGTVDMKDWEIGGFKMVQSYGGVPNWGDQGYAYMMYKTVADDLGQGGIWNHCVHVLNVKEECNPQATMKVTLTHNSRDMIKVVAGLSNNINATTPDYFLEFPIFNYQGGPQFMQGGSSNPDNKTIEFGLDVSPLLSLVDLNQDVRFFLQVFEYDPNGIGWGQLNYFSVFDYTNGTAEIVCPQSNVSLNNNDVTTLSLVANFSFNRVNITSSSLPAAGVGQPYNFQLTAAGGEAPYSFKLLNHYEESLSSETFPGITGQQLIPANNGSGFVTRSLDFDFPYYDSVYSSVTVHVDGYLMFDEQLFPFPYFIDDMVMFRTTRHISPFMCHGIRIYPSENDGIWYEGDSNSATFRWKASIDGSSGSTELNFAVKLYPSGNIEFYYGDMLIDNHTLWISGLCDGNEDDMQFTSCYPENLPAVNTKYTYDRYSYPEGISVSEEGVVSGMVQQPVNAEPMTFKVTDNNFIYSTKTLTFSTTGISITDSISSGDDDIIEYGETVKQSVTLTNLEANPVSDASISILINDPYVTMIDDYEYIGNLAVGESITLADAFSFKLAPDVPDAYPVEIQTTIDGTRQIWENTLMHLVHAPVIELAGLFVDDSSNHLLDPGETCNITIEIFNSGSSEGSQLNCALESADPFITINTGTLLIQQLIPDSSVLLTFNISVDEQAPIGHIATFDLNIQGIRDFETTLTFDMNIGLTTEDFETGDFHLFSWGFKGNRDWKSNEQFPFEGIYCARSGNISHQQSSSMILDLDVLYAGEVSFYRMVSCEDSPNDNYDFLSFLIDDTEIARWDSILPWEQVSFALTEGFHRLEWRYTKDSTVSKGLDAAFIDLISLPGCLDAMPHLDVIPVYIEKAMYPETLDIDTLMLINPGEGGIEFDIMIATATDAPYGSRSIAGSYLECEQLEFYTGEDFDWDFTLFNASDDNEWIQHLTIQLPQGVFVESASNFSGGSGGDLEFEGSMGNGPLMSWYGEDASGWGTVHGGEYAYGNIDGYIDPGFSGNAILEYVITGDIYGSEPHVLEGQIELTNLGSTIDWLTCDVYNGNVPGQETAMVMLTFNTAGLDDGDYYCDIIMRDNFQHETIIPVHLLVDTYLRMPENKRLKAGLEVYPNPFSEMINLIVHTDESTSASIRIVDLQGRTREIITSNLMLGKGTHNFEWVPGLQENIGPGMYFVIADLEDQRYIKKIIMQE